MQRRSAVMKRVRGPAVITVALAGILTVLLTAPPSNGASPTHPAHRKHLPANVTVEPKDVNSLRNWAAAQRSADTRRLTAKRQAGPTPAPAPAPAAVAPKAAAATGTGTLVLYDTTGDFGFLGELYALATRNLASHFGAVTARPVSTYTTGQINQFAAVVYIGSTYYDATSDGIPTAFYTDVAASSVPVVWMNDNIWNFANRVGPATFINTYGWDPTNSFFSPGGSIGNVTSVTYKSQQLDRKIPAGQDPGVLHPAITGGTAPPVTTLAVANDAANGGNFGWAIRSKNLTYIGEIPFTYVSESDRIVVFEDLLFDALAPATPVRHRAMVRLEDINPTDDPAELMATGQYLFSQNIPFGVNVVPVWKDSLGFYNNGVPETITLRQAPQVVTAIKWLLSHGGVLMDHGYTHQYGAVANPYSGASVDDFEFFRSHIDAGNNVVLDGPVAEDSTSWAQSRITNAFTEFQRAGLAKPTLFTAPHYAASAADYNVFKQNFPVRWERSLYYQGQLSGGAINPTHYIGQFFPYRVTDAYGSAVLPENLGNYEPEAQNNHPPRLPADLIRNAQANLPVRDGFASFFYHPSFPVGPLQEIVNGVRGLGYTFVSPTSVTN